MQRRLFCEINEFTYRISITKEKMKRNLKQLFSSVRYANQFDSNLHVVIYKHQSLIRRKLGQVDPVLQENKAENLKLAASCLNGIIIKPGEVFSFWRLVGNCTAKKGYKRGLIIKSGATSHGIGGGLCQLSNLIHWMVLHSPLKIMEHHHHNGLDLFPDYNRQIPFGTGTSIMHNYLDYQFYNPTKQAFQLKIWTSDSYLHGELRSSKALDYSYHIKEEDSAFIKEGDSYYRTNQVYLSTINKSNGSLVSKVLLVKNKAKVMYDPIFIPVHKIDTKTLL